MNKAYEEHTLRILSEAGPQGISLRKLALNVYNISASFFDGPSFEAVYRHVQQYVWRNSQTANSLVEHTDKWGHYRLSRSPQARQLILQFGSAEVAVAEQDPPSHVEEQQPLSLFDSEWADTPAKAHDPNQPLDLFGDY